MRKNWIAGAVCAALSVATAAEPTTAEILQQLQALQQQVQQQQQMIESLKSQLQSGLPSAASAPSEGQVSDLVRQEVNAAMEKHAAAKAGSGPTISLGKGIDGLKITGDLRLRHEYADLEGDPEWPVAKSPERKDDQRIHNRFRHRARLGGVWTNSSENWEIGLGMEYGSSSGNSANDSWNKSSTWESGDAYLDYAYAKHTFTDALAGLTITLGQQKNPYLSTFALFDGDLRPTGATVQYEKCAFFGAAGAYNLRSDNKVTGSDDQTTADMVAAQVGLKWKSGDHHAKIAGAIYAGDSETSEYVFGEGNDDYTYRIGHLYGEAGTKLGPVGAKLFAEYFANFGVDDKFTQLSYAPKTNFGGTYDSEDNDTAWCLGTEFGWRQFKASYAYAQIEGDSVPKMFADSDFGAGLPDGALNSKGHVLSLGYGITKNCEVRGTLFLASPLETDQGNDDADVLQTQLDVIYKF
jgi:hypothetical protein